MLDDGSILDSRTRRNNGKIVKDEEGMRTVSANRKYT